MRALHTMHTAQCALDVRAFIYSAFAIRNCKSHPIKFCATLSSTPHNRPYNVRFSINAQRSEPPMVGQRVFFVLSFLFRLQNECLSQYLWNQWISLGSTNAVAIAFTYIPHSPSKRIPRIHRKWPLICFYNPCECEMKTRICAGWAHSQLYYFHFESKSRRPQ